MWKQFVSEITNEYSFEDPAKADEIQKLERSLGVQLPDELRALLTESNGIKGEYGIDVIWSVQRIEADNLLFRKHQEFRDLYMPFDHLLFFADAGNGDQFAFAIQNGIVRRPDVFVWDHEDDSRRWVAPSLREYLSQRLKGTLKV